jgi:hypothetical protein
MKKRTARRRIVPASGNPGYNIRAKVWLYPGDAGWHFVNLPTKQSREIRDLVGANRRGWGAVPVTIKIGKTEWNTSLFPDSQSDSYLFPIKVDVRRKERIAAGDTIRAQVQIRTANLLGTVIRPAPRA